MVPSIAVAMMPSVTGVNWHSAIGAALPCASGLLCPAPVVLLCPPPVGDCDCDCDGKSALLTLVNILFTLEDTPEADAMSEREIRLHSNPYSTRS